MEGEKETFEKFVSFVIQHEFLLFPTLLVMPVTVQT